MRALETNLGVLLVRQQTVPPMSKIGFIQMKLAVASFASSIAMGKISSSAESPTVIRADAFHSDSCLGQGQPLNAHAPYTKIVPCAKLAVLPLPGLR